MNTNEIRQIVPAAIEFPHFDDYVKQAEGIANYIRSFEYSDENVKAAKQIVADARKITKELDRRRIAIKNEVLEPYLNFEKKIKFITAIIEDAEMTLRKKINDGEDNERAIKEQVVRELFDKRSSMYSFVKIIPDAFSFFLEPRHLNKTTSLKSVEIEMAKWMEDVQGELNTINSLPDREELLIEYAGTMNLSQSIQAVNKRHEIVERFEDDSEGTENSAFFKITGTANIKLTQRLLHENGIPFTLRT